MKTIGLEEHFVTTDVIEAWSRLEPQWHNPPGLAGDDDLKRRLAASLKRPVSEYFRTNMFVTPSGVFSQRYLRWAIEVMGLDRTLFSTDYPYRFVSDGGARRFLEEAELIEADREMIGSGNWERLCAAIRR